MRPKYKMTGCARFFIFLIIFVPIVYFGAAYFRGDDGMQILKNFWHNTIGSSQSPDNTPAKSEETYEIESLEKELEKAKEEIRELKVTIYEKDLEIKKLKSGTE